jgi:hypothetical protein
MKRTTDVAILAGLVMAATLFWFTGRPGPAMGVLVSTPVAPQHEATPRPPAGLEAARFTATIDGVVYRAEMAEGVTPEGASVLVETWTADGQAIDVANLPDAVQATRAEWVAWSIRTIIRTRRDIGGGTA